MSDSYDFTTVTHFTAGAQGQPGQRVFFLQIGDTERHISVKLEKQQVMALAQYLRGVLEDLPAPPAHGQLDPVPAVEPAFAQWVVGQIAVGVDDTGSEVVLVVDEMVPEDEEDDDDLDDLFEVDSHGARIRAHISVEQAARFVATSDDLMAKGRPPCRLCGQPLNPTGHICPRWN